MVSMAAYNVDDYSVPQGGGRYIAPSLDMMYHVAQISKSGYLLTLTSSLDFSWRKVSRQIVGDFNEN